VGVALLVGAVVWAEMLADSSAEPAATTAYSIAADEPWVGEPVQISPDGHYMVAALEIPGRQSLLVATRISRDRSHSDPTRLDVIRLDEERGWSASVGERDLLTLTPDGRFAFLEGALEEGAGPDQAEGLSVLSLDDGEIRPIPEVPAGGRVLGFADPETLVYHVWHDALYAVPTGRGEPIVLTEGSFTPAVLTADGTAVVFEDQDSGDRELANLYSVSLDGGDRIRLNDPEAVHRRTDVRWWRVSGDGEWVYYQSRTDPSAPWDLWAIRPDGTGRTLLTTGLADRGTVAFAEAVEGGVLFSVRRPATQLFFFSSGPEFDAVPVPGFEGIDRDERVMISPDRTVAMFRATSGGLDTVRVVPIPEGTSAPVVAEGPWSARFGPDGSSVWLSDGAQTVEHPREGTPVRFPYLRPYALVLDGCFLAFDLEPRGESGGDEILLMPTGGGHFVPLITPERHDEEILSMTVLSDGRHVIYTLGRREFEGGDVIVSVPRASFLVEVGLGPGG